MKKISLAKPNMTEQEFEAVRETLASGWIAGDGPKNKEFAKRACERYGFNHALLVNNCTAALHLALLAFDIKEGDEVLVADFTWPATGNSVRYVGATPIFVDADPETYNFSVEDAKRKVTQKTKALICVHEFGQPCDMDEICEFAKEHGLKVIEDAACAFGATYKGEPVGGFGDAACFSFHARKNISCGEGGLLVIKDEEAYKIAHSYMHFGLELKEGAENKTRDSHVARIGFNYKLSDIGAAILLVQLERYEEMLKKRVLLVEEYEKRLRGVEGIRVPVKKADRENVYQSFVCVVASREQRDALMQHLKEKGIESQLGTYSSCIQPAYDTKNQCLESIKLYEQSIALPLHTSLSKEDISEVCDTIKEFFEGT